MRIVVIRVDAHGNSKRYGSVATDFNRFWWASWHRENHSCCIGVIEQAIKSSGVGCTFAKQAADKIDEEIPPAATATENSLKALLAGTKARLAILNDENKALGWTRWRGSREEEISASWPFSVMMLRLRQPMPIWRSPV
jgi:hypothetical protein